MCMKVHIYHIRNIYSLIIFKEPRFTAEKVIILNNLIMHDNDYDLLGDYIVVD